MTIAEVPRYAGQTWPCFGVQSVGWGQTTRFAPFVHDGRIVHWGFAEDDRQVARQVATAMAAKIDQTLYNGDATVQGSRG
jgi:hypothetical protein